MTPQEMGRKGGLATMAKLTKKQRSTNAKKAATARWNKKHGNAASK